jgi:hypothetical protein
MQRGVLTAGAIAAIVEMVDGRCETYQPNVGVVILDPVSPLNKRYRVSTKPANKLMTNVADVLNSV